MEITLEAIISLLGLFIDAGTYAYYHDFRNVVVGGNERKLVGVPAVSGTLDSTKTWRVVVWISGEETQIQLMQPVS